MFTWNALFAGFWESLLCHSVLLSAELYQLSSLQDQAVSWIPNWAGGRGVDTHLWTMQLLYRLHLQWRSGCQHEQRAGDDETCEEWSRVDSEALFEQQRFSMLFLQSGRRDLASPTGKMFKKSCPAPWTSLSHLKEVREAQDLEVLNQVHWLWLCNNNSKLKTQYSVKLRCSL